MGSHILHLDPLVIGLLVSLFIPLATGILNKLRAGSALKAITAAVLSVVTGIITAAAADPGAGIPITESVIAILSAFVVSSATYAHVWAPTGVAGFVNNKTANFGLGSDGSEYEYGKAA